MGLLKVELKATSANLGQTFKFAEASVKSGLTQGLGMVTMFISAESAQLPYGAVSQVHGIAVHLVSRASTNPLFLWQSGVSPFSRAGGLRFDSDDVSFHRPADYVASRAPFRAYSDKGVTFQFGLFGN